MSYGDTIRAITAQCEATGRKIWCEMIEPPDEEPESDEPAFVLISTRWGSVAYWPLRPADPVEDCKTALPQFLAFLDEPESTSCTK